MAEPCNDSAMLLVFFNVDIKSRISYNKTRLFEQLFMFIFNIIFIGSPARPISPKFIR